MKFLLWLKKQSFHSWVSGIGLVRSLLPPTRAAGRGPIRSQRDLDSFLKNPSPCGFASSQRSPWGYNLRKLVGHLEANWTALALQGEHRYSKNFLGFTLHLGGFRLFPMACELWPLPIFATVNTFPSHCPSLSLLLLALGSLNIPLLVTSGPFYFLFLLPEKLFCQALYGCLLLVHWVLAQPAPRTKACPPHISSGCPLPLCHVLSDYSLVSGII